MTRFKKQRYTMRRIAVLCATLLLAACLNAGKAPVGASSVGAPETAAGAPKAVSPTRAEELEIADLSRIPQDLDRLAAAAGDRLALSDTCRTQLRDEFQSRFYAPWSAAPPRFDPVEAGDFMKQEGRVVWYGPNKRKLPPKLMQEFMENCALEHFPSRNDTAISVAPGHLRGLPTYLPLYQSAEDYPFDMLSYPQVKLNEPLRVLHESRDGVWLFVETGYTNGWLERRDVALVDQNFIKAWMRAPHLVVVQDYASIPDGRGVGVSRSKVGTVLPLAGEAEGSWEVSIASAGEGGGVQNRRVRIPRGAAAKFPLEFSRENVALIGDQLLGDPYGWGEIYDLRDCSAMLRDFFLPFGIWLPRTSADQVASVPRRLELARMTPAEKESAILSTGIPFLTLLYKLGHIMLYVGADSAGRPLVFHDAWSIRLKDSGDAAPAGGSGSAADGTINGVDKNGAECKIVGNGPRTQIIGASAITTLEPGKELGLVPGSSLLERITELAVIPNRCQEPSRPEPPR